MAGLVRARVPSLARSFVGWLVRPSIRPSVRSFVRPSARSFIHSFAFVFVLGLSSHSVCSLAVSFLELDRLKQVRVCGVAECLTRCASG